LFLLGFFVCYMLAAMSAIFFEFQTIFQRLFIFIGKIINALAHGAFQLD